MIELLFVFVISAVIGYAYRDIRDNVEGLWAQWDKEEAPEKKPGVTMGSYNHVDEVHPQYSEIKARGHVVTPKTPQKMEWDAENELQEKNEKFHVGPK